MKKIIFSIIAVLTITSCAAPSKFGRISSANYEEMQQEENGDFLVEHEDIWIAYSFKGVNAPMQITIFNKSEEDIYIDWNQSELLTTQSAYTLSPIGLNLSEFVTTGYLPEIFDGNGMFSDSLTNLSTQSGELSMIPKNHMLTYIPVELNTSSLKRKIDEKLFTKNTLTSSNNTVYEIERVEYSALNSPLLFRAKICFFTASQRLQTVESDFYLSSQIKTKSFNEKTVPDKLLERGDLFYINERAKENRVYDVGVGGTIVIGL